VDEGLLAAAPPETLYFEWSIITDPLDIDGQDGGDTVIDVEGAATEESSLEPESMDNSEKEDNETNEIDDLNDSDRYLDNEELNQTSTNLSTVVPPSQNPTT
jgi:hypothetical protein